MDDLTIRPAVEQAALLRDRAVSAGELLDAHLARIDARNPAVNALVTLVPELARAAAAESDRRLAAGAARPLEGLPVAVKDTVLTAGIRTTFGSPIFRDHVPDRDGLVAERLKAAGAVIVGKSNVPELAAGSHTFNEVFGATRNPYAHDRTPGGSTGGGAAALTLGLVALADGSDMGGSLRNPAAFCNVVGFRPTVGRVPAWPTADPWGTLSTEGPLGRTVADAALLLSALAGPDPRSPIALDLDGAALTAPLDRDVAGVRVGWSADLGGLPVDPEIRAVLADARGVFERLGCAVVDVEPDLSAADEAFRAWRAWGFHLAWGHLLPEHADALKPEILDELARGARVTGEDLARAQRARARLLASMTALMERVDVLAGPTTQVLPFAIEERWPTVVAGTPMTDYLDWMRSCWHLSPLGWPAISVPGGFTPAGLPVGLQLLGPARADLAVLQLAHAFEAATGHGAIRPPG